MMQMSNFNYSFWLNTLSFKKNEITLIIVLLLVFLHLLISIFFLFNYIKIIVPRLGENRTAKRNLLASDVCEKYCKYFKIENINVNSNAKYKTIYNANDSKGELHLVNYKFFSDTYYLSALNLDYVLGRLFYWTEKRIYKNNLINKLGFWLYFLPSFTIYCFYIFTVILIIFNSVINSDSTILLTSNFLNFVYHFNILEIIVILFFTLHLLTIIFNSHYKTLLENEYERKIKKFVHSEFNELFGDWIIARGYARSVFNTYTFGFNFIYKKFFKYTGPFSL